jgi:hypothetical protein
MVAFPSRIGFAALLAYAPRGNSVTSKNSRVVTYAIKQDGTFKAGAASYLNAIDYTTKRLSEVMPKHPFLADYFNLSVTLVPCPRSSLTKPGSLWPANRICQSIFGRGLAANVLPCLYRTKAVQRSATAAPGQRPAPDEHHESVEVKTQALLNLPTSITLVDDVITRGSSLLAFYKRAEEAFPGIPIRCFAVVRTMSFGEVTSILDPVAGTISYNGTSVSRHP